MKICEDTVRAAVDSGLGSVRMDAAQKRAILAQCRPTVEAVPPRRAARRPARRALALAAAFALAFCLGGGVLAASPELKQTLAMLGENTLAMLQPVNQQSEDQGIRMEVLAAMSDGQAAAVYLSLEDTEGLGRVGPDAELYTSQVTGATFTGSQVVGYDETAGRAVLRLVADANEQLAGKKITVSAGAITSGFAFNDPVDLGCSFGEVEQYTGGTAVQYGRKIRGYSASGPRLEACGQLVDSGRMPTLTGWDQPAALPGVDWATVSAAAVVDGRLHIQVNQLDGMGRVNRLRFALQDPATGRLVDCTCFELELGQEHEVGPFRSYNDLVEYVLVPPEDVDAAGLRVMLCTDTYDHFVEGDWSTTFRLEEAGEVISIPCELDMEPWTLTEVRLSPISVTAFGKGEMTAESRSADLEVYLADGSLVDCTSASVFAGETDITSRCIFDAPIDLDQVSRVTLNGQDLPLP